LGSGNDFAGLSHRESLVRPGRHGNRQGALEWNSAPLANEAPQKKKKKKESERYEEMQKLTEVLFAVDGSRPGPDDYNNARDNARQHPEPRKPKRVQAVVAIIWVRHFSGEQNLLAHVGAKPGQS